MKLTITSMNSKFACVVVLITLLSSTPAHTQAQARGDSIDIAGLGEFPYNNNIPSPASRTFVLDGLLLQMGPVDNRNGDRIPFLSNIPILGGLFQNTRSNGHEPRNLLIFLTPRIVRED